MLEPDKQDFYLAQLAWRIYVFEIRLLGAMKGEKVKEFKEFFINREVPKHKTDQGAAEQDEETKALILKRAADRAKLSVITRMGLPPPPPQVIG